MLQEDFSKYSFPLAICIVLSGMYEDDLDNSEDIIYTGQGGQDLLGNKRQIRNQTMERGNLALKVINLFPFPQTYPHAILLFVGHFYFEC